MSQSEVLQQEVEAEPAVAGMAEGNPAAQEAPSQVSEHINGSTTDVQTGQRLPAVAGEEALPSASNAQNVGKADPIMATTGNDEVATQGMNLAEIDAVIPPPLQPGNEEPATEGMKAEAVPATETNEEPAVAGIAQGDVPAVIPPAPTPGNVDAATEGMSTTQEPTQNGSNGTEEAARQSESSTTDPATEGMSLSEVPAVIPPAPLPGNVEPATEGMQVDSTTSEDPASSTSFHNALAGPAAGDISMQSDTGEVPEAAGTTADANGAVPLEKALSTYATEGENEGPRTKIYIGGLPPRTERADLEDCFGQFGEIEHVELKTGYAFIVRLISLSSFDPTSPSPLPLCSSVTRAFSLLFPPDPFSLNPAKPNESLTTITRAPTSRAACLQRCLRDFE